MPARLCGPPRTKMCELARWRSRVLCVYPAPRIVTVNGRDLAVEDPGLESGFPVIVHNGAGVGFDLADIQAPVSLWHGRQDFLPLAHARWLADRIPNVTTHFPADQNHTNIEENNRAAAFAWLADRI